MVERELKRQKLVDKYAAKRAELKLKVITSDLANFQKTQLQLVYTIVVA